MDDDENYGDRIMRIAQEQNVSQASAARGARIEMRLERKMKRRREQQQEKNDAQTD